MLIDFYTKNKTGKKTLIETSCITIDDIQRWCDHIKHTYQLSLTVYADNFGRLLGKSI